jgi:hypothetical protein
MRVGDAVVHPGGRDAEVALPGLRPLFLGATAGDPAPQAGHEAVPAMDCDAHFDGINRSRLGQRERIGSAAVNAD